MQGLKTFLSERIDRLEEVFQTLARVSKGASEASEGVAKAFKGAAEASEFTKLKEINLSIDPTLSRPIQRSFDFNLRDEFESEEEFDAFVFIKKYKWIQTTGNQQNKEAADEILQGIPTEDLGAFVALPDTEYKSQITPSMQGVLQKLKDPRVKVLLDNYTDYIVNLCLKTDSISKYYGENLEFIVAHLPAAKVHADEAEVTKNMEMIYEFKPGPRKPSTYEEKVAYIEENVREFTDYVEGQWTDSVYDMIYGSPFTVYAKYKLLKAPLCAAIKKKYKDLFSFLIPALEKLTLENNPQIKRILETNMTICPERVEELKNYVLNLNVLDAFINKEVYRLVQFDDVYRRAADLIQKRGDKIDVRLRNINILNGTSFRELYKAFTLQIDRFKKELKSVFDPESITKITDVTKIGAKSRWNLPFEDANIKKVVYLLSVIEPFTEMKKENPKSPAFEALIQQIREIPDKTTNPAPPTLGGKRTRKTKITARRNTRKTRLFKYIL